MSLLDALQPHGYVEISHGTLSTFDLTKAGISALQQYGSAEEAAKIIADIPKGALEDDDHVFWCSDDASYLLNETLFDMLSDLSPPGYCFGASEGDGSSIGWWRCNDDEDELRDAASEEDCHV